MAKQAAVFIILFFMAWSSKAQSVDAVSHYPESAYRALRLLPFSIQGDRDVMILGVNIVEGTGCSAMKDPFYPDVYHIFCQEEGDVQVEVQYQEAGRERTLTAPIISLQESLQLQGTPM